MYMSELAPAEIRGKSAGHLQYLRGIWRGYRVFVNYLMARVPADVGFGAGRLCFCPWYPPLRC